MSSILQALERAEQERNALDPAPLRQPLSRTKPLWQRPGIWLFGAGLVLLNILVWWLMLDTVAPPQVAEAQPENTRIESPPAMPQARPRTAPQLAEARQPPRVSPPPSQPVKPLSPAIPAETSAPPLLEVALPPAPIPTPKVQVAKAQPAPQPIAAPAAETTGSAAKAIAEQVIAEPRVHPVAEEPKPVSRADKLNVPPSQATAATPPAELPVSLPVEKPESVAKLDKVSLPETPAPGPEVTEQAAEETPEVEIEAAPRIPEIWELPAKVQKKLKGLEITIHVYNDTPAARFVIIDMRRYREGDPLEWPGLRLDQITREGVVIDYGEGKVKI